MEKGGLRRIGFVYRWFPVLPFLVYWSASILLYHFGPFAFPKLDSWTYVYLFSMVLLFIVAYSSGLGAGNVEASTARQRDSRVAGKVLRFAAIMAVVGTTLLLVDRLASGAGSIGLVLNSLEYLREDEYAKRLTVLTAIAVIPYSFHLTTFAAYFYCLMNHVAVSSKIHLLVIGIMAMDLMNMALTGSRGMLFWLGTYWVFYAVFCKRIPVVKTILSKKYRWTKLAMAALVILSLSFFYFVSRNRTPERYLTILGEAAIEQNNIGSLPRYMTVADLGAVYSLYTYVTHEFVYINAFVKRADWIAFNPAGALGQRVTSQIAKLSPGYTPAAKVVSDQWLGEEGLSLAGWPSIFGVTLVYFGIAGSGIFYTVLGFLCGKCTRLYLRTKKFGWFILVFVIYVSFNFSFDWIIRDFEQYVATMIGIFLLSDSVRRRSRAGRSFESMKAGGATAAGGIARDGLGA